MGRWPSHVETGRIGFAHARAFLGSSPVWMTFFSSVLWVYSSMSLVRSNLGFLRTLTFLMRTFSSGKILEHSLVMVLPIWSPMNCLKSSLRDAFWHLGADELLLRVLGIAGSLDLSLVASCECDAEHSDEIPIGGLGLHEGFNSGVPLLDESAKLVSGDVNSVEVSVAVHSLHFFHLESALPPGLLVGITVQIGE